MESTMDEIEELRKELSKEKERCSELKKRLDSKNDELSSKEIDANLDLKKSYLQGIKDNSDFLLKEVRNIITPAIFHLDHLLQLNEIDKSDESIYKILAYIKEVKGKNHDFKEGNISEALIEVKNLKRMVNEKGMLAYKSINKITDVIAHNRLYNEKGHASKERRE